MKSFLSVLTFFLVNAIGFNIGPVFYILTLKHEWVDTASESFNPIGLQNDLVNMPTFIWLACALFSFAFFFMRGIWRKVFLFAPVIIPLFATLALLQRHM